MSLFAQLKEVRTERKKILDAAGAILTKAFADNKRALTPEEEQDWEKRHTDGDRLQKDIERLEKQYEVELSLGGAAGDKRTAGQEDVLASGSVRDMDDKTKQKVLELRSVEWRSWLLGGIEYLSPELQKRHATLTETVGREYREYRALSATNASTGATVIPQGFIYTLETALKYFGGIIDAAAYIDTDQGNILPYPSINDTGNTAENLTENSQVAGSTGGSSETDPAFGVVNFNAYMHDSGFVKVPIQLVQDSAFNVDEFLEEQLKIRIGRKLNTNCTTGAGTGSSLPTGVITAATQGVLSASGTGIAYNDLLNLFHSVDPSYRVGPKVGWMFNDSTLLAIKKLVDGNGRPLFIAGGTAEGIQNAAPDKIHGCQYWINQDMATIADNAKTVLFGDFSKYKIRRVKTLQLIKAVERFVDALQVAFIAFQRFDGNLLDAGTHPIKYLAQNAS